MRLAEKQSGREFAPGATVSSLLRRASRFIGHMINRRAWPISSLGLFSDLCSGLMPVILSKAVGLPFIQPNHVCAVSNFFVVFVVSRFRHLHSLSELGSNWRSPNAQTMREPHVR